jgi:hypothetical protein
MTESINGLLPGKTGKEGSPREPPPDSQKTLDKNQK